jgi:hypothetical protein
VSYQSGQMGSTDNRVRNLRRFKSYTHDQFYSSLVSMVKCSAVNREFLVRVQEEEPFITVSSNGRTSGFGPENRGSNPRIVSNVSVFNSVVECLPYKEKVVGSNPARPTKILME